ncbi:kielin/chordin-like protein [Glandiceps talaboti]
MEIVMLCHVPTQSLCQVNAVLAVMLACMTVEGLDGDIVCERKQCDPIICTHPFLDDCGCRLCYDCEVEGERYGNGEMFADPNDECKSCRCLNGNVECIAKTCTSVTCTSPGRDNCNCPLCLHCEVEGQLYSNGEIIINRRNKCQTCRCMNGNIECIDRRCQQVTCSSPAMDDCNCPICEDCIYLNDKHKNGDTFFEPNDPCKTCQCVRGDVTCQTIPCPPITCRNPVTRLGECCPQCLGCLSEGIEYGDGESWTSATNACLSCKCEAGITTCIEIRCIVPESCSRTIQIPGQCCPLCQGCRHAGISYRNGESFMPGGDPCETCTCENGNLKCFRRTCSSLLDCPPELIEPAPHGECCATCRGIPSGSNCTEDNVGRKVQPFQDPCFVCECKDASSWECLRIDCPTLSCQGNEQYTRQGDCCARCDRCFVESEDKSYDNGEVWSDPTNQCITCSCTDGAITCDVEECQVLLCQDNFELYNPPDQCCPVCRDVNVPCQLGGTTYKPNEKWIKDECTSCECKAGEVRCITTRCVPISCLADETPAIAPGMCCPRCVPRPATCIAYGDPHYRTFDGKTIHFQGTCKYIMAMDCENQDFTVEVKNDDRGAFGAVSWTQEVTVIVSGLKVQLGQSGLVEVNGQAVLMPYLRDPFLYIEMRAGNNFYVNTDVGLKVHWDGKSYVEVSVPGTYSGKTCGLCGNFNSYPQDDLRMRGDQITTSISRFGNSWKVFGPEQEQCEDARDIDPCTEAGYRARKLANAKCAVLKSVRFEKCHRVIPPETYFASCVYDMCACGADDGCLCDVLSAYAAECRQGGVMLSWRSTSLCAIKCPEERGLIFDECGPPCPRTCENKDVPVGVIEAQCFRPCVPGCQCPAGRVLFDARCIDPDDCPAIIYGSETIQNDSNEKEAILMHSRFTYK